MTNAREWAWPELRDFALGLGLPRVEETTSWGQPTLKAHGKLWVWWSPHEDAPVFKVSREEREVLLDAEPDIFFCTPHYRGHALVLMRPERLDRDWIRANLIRVWRAQAPKRFLKAYDLEHPADIGAPTLTALPQDLITSAEQALETAGYGTLEALSTATEKEIKAVKGIGPKSMKVLIDALAQAGLSFAQKD